MCIRGKNGGGTESMRLKVCTSVLRTRTLLWLSLSGLLWGAPSLAQSQQKPLGEAASVEHQLPAGQLSGSINGTVVDPSQAAVAGARVKLSRPDQSTNKEVLTGDQGDFSLPDIAPGPFQLTITAPGFTPQIISGILNSGEVHTVPQVVLVVAPATAEMQVEPPPVEIAEEQIKEEEKQRVLGVIPNFYVSYVPNAVPLTPKQKFELALKTTVDPVTIAVTGAIAGVEQGRNDFSGYGQGAQGYGKRFGANYADAVAGIFIGSAILPSVLKQDPRYFYKGSGSTQSRILYAIANAVICKGDNGHWQANYSGILGSLAAGGISNLYYPATSRNGAALTFEETAIGIGASAAANILEEFVMRKLTTNASHDPPKP